MLLAQYFFCLGLNLEGRYHANAAVTLAIGCGLHRTGSQSDNQNAIGGGNATVPWFRLTAAADDTEKTERIRMFWVVFNLDSCWSVALEVPRSLSDEMARGTQIDTPWSGEEWVCTFFLIRSKHFTWCGSAKRLTRYLPQYDTSGKTVQKFLSGYSIIDERDSYVVLRAKSSALYERAASLAGI